MSIPTTSAAPDAPEQTSPMRPDGEFRGWFTKITKWIAGMTPSGESQYETPWANIALNSTFTVSLRTPRAKRTGKRFELDGGIASSSGFPSGGVAVGQFPFNPTRQVVFICPGLGIEVHKVVIDLSGLVTVYGSGGTDKYVRLDGQGWTI